MVPVHKTAILVNEVILKELSECEKYNKMDRYRFCWDHSTSIINRFLYLQKSGWEKEYNPEVLENLDEASQKFVKNTSPLSDVDSRYKYMRLATKALPSAKDIEIGDVENKKLMARLAKFQLEFIRRKKTDLLKLSFTIMVADLF